MIIHMLFGQFGWCMDLWKVVGWMSHRISLSCLIIYKGDNSAHAISLKKALTFACIRTFTE